MNSNNPTFIACAMEATEQGIPAQEIKEECACRMGFSDAESLHEHVTTNKRNM